MNVTTLYNVDWPVVFMFGPRESGKTTLLKFLIQKTNLLQDINDVFIVSPTCLDQGIFEDIFASVEDKRIFVKTFSDIDYSAIPEQSLLIFDDTGKITKTNFKNTLIRNRHRKIKIIFLGHYFYHLEPELRSNLDFLITFKNMHGKEKKHIYEEYVNSKMEFDEFEKFYNSLENHEFIIIALKQNLNISKCVLADV